jgi:hypothetical protein
MSPENRAPRGDFGRFDQAVPASVDWIPRGSISVTSAVPQTAGLCANPFPVGDRALAMLLASEEILWSSATCVVEGGNASGRRYPAKRSDKFRPAP